MKVIVLGANGMIGHRLTYDLASFGHEVWAGVRAPNRDLERLKSLTNFNLFCEEKMTDMSALTKHLEKIKPDIILNALGIVKQNPLCQNAEIIYQTNSVFPQQLAMLCEKLKIRFIQLSSDCIFTGKKGNYTELDVPDAEDLYGKSKFLGEIKGMDNVLTIRSSWIGHEMNTKISLLEWFLHSSGTIKGFSNALYTGFTTKEFSLILNQIVFPNKKINGLLHLASPAISKYDLLHLFKKHFKKDIQINTDDALVKNLILDGTQFIKLTGFVPKSWDQMISELANDQLSREFYV